MARQLFAVVALLAVAACGALPRSSTGSSVALRPGGGVVEAIQEQGVAAPQPSASIQGAPAGISVYDATTYNQPSYTYPSTARALTGETPRDPPPGGVSARTNIPRLIVRMDDGSRQALNASSLPGLRVGDRVEVATDGSLTRP
jgi:hypothetical protein